MKETGQKGTPGTADHGTYSIVFYTKSYLQCAILQRNPSGIQYRYRFGVRSTLGSVWGPLTTVKIVSNPRQSYLSSVGNGGLETTSVLQLEQVEILSATPTH